MACSSPPEPCRRPGPPTRLPFILPALPPWATLISATLVPSSKTRHRRAANLDRAEHQVCEFFKPAVQTTRIVLAIRTFDGPVLRATRNSVILTMWLAPPCPTLARPGNIDKKSSQFFRAQRNAPRGTPPWIPGLRSRPHRAPHHATRRAAPTTLQRCTLPVHDIPRHPRHLAHLAETYGWRSLP